MENHTLAVTPVVTGNLGRRVTSLVAAVALVFAALILVQQRADAAPPGAPVAAAVAVPSLGDGIAAQIDVRQFVCPTLLAIRAAFAGSPFFGFIAAALDPIIASFGCAPSPG